MAEGFDANRIIHGSKGYLFWNGRKIAGLQSVEIKAACDWETFNVCGEMTTYHVLNGYEVDGSFSYLKCDSSILSDLWQAVINGVWPAISIVTGVSQRGSFKTQRCSVSDIIVNELMLMKFEKKAYTTEEIPFKGGVFKMLDLIA